MSMMVLRYAERILTRKENLHSLWWTDFVKWHSDNAAQCVSGKLLTKHQTWNKTMRTALNQSIRVLTNRLDNDKLASVLAQVANKANISTGKFKRARADLPFPDAKWSKYAPRFGLTPGANNLNKNSFDTFKTPSYHLPPSFHVAIFENAWLWQEVYQKRSFERPEEASLRTLDPVC